MNALLVMLLTAFVGIRANAASVVVDASRSHTVEDLKRSGLRIAEIAGGLHGQAYSFQNQEVEIRLPAGRTVTQNTMLGTIDTKDGKLNQLSMYGDVMPLEQAVQIARQFHESYGLPVAELTTWKSANQNGTRNGYSVSPVLKSYPIVSLAIDSSVNKQYPWVVRFEIDWGWKEQRDWNEERAWRELPLPAIAAISLNPPSGQKYERGDAYKESLEAQKRFEQEQPVKGPASIPAIAPMAASPAAANPSLATPKFTPAVQTRSTSAVLWPRLVGIVALTVIALLVWKRRT